MILFQQQTNSCEETEMFAEQFGKTLVGGDCVLLNGDLGAGKTHFVKGLARALEIDDVITSPTFALHNIYQGKMFLNHFDFYRVDDSQEVAILGLNEYFSQKNGVSAIEWSCNVADLLPQNCIVVTIEKISEFQRKITIER